MNVAAGFWYFPQQLKFPHEYFFINTQTLLLYLQQCLQSTCFFMIYISNKTRPFLLTLP